MAGPDIARLFKQRIGANTPAARTCKYIEGSKPYGPEPWCGKPAVPGCSYCPQHKLVCFVVMDEQSTIGFKKHAEFIARISR